MSRQAAPKDACPAHRITPCIRSIVYDARMSHNPTENSRIPRIYNGIKGVVKKKGVESGSSGIKMRKAQSIAKIQKTVGW